MFCNGQILDIRTNTALYSLLGTRFGGDGKTSFALPDLRGRITIETSIIASLDEGTEAAPMADGYLAVSTPTGNSISNIYVPALGPGGSVSLAKASGDVSFTPTRDQCQHRRRPAIPGRGHRHRHLPADTALSGDAIHYCRGRCFSDA